MIAEQKKDRVERRRRIEVFLDMLKDQNEYVRFDPYTFMALVEKVMVEEDGELEFIFRNGTKANMYKNRNEIKKV